MGRRRDAFLCIIPSSQEPSSSFHFLTSHPHPQELCKGPGSWLSPETNRTARFWSPQVQAPPPPPSRVSLQTVLALAGQASPRCKGEIRATRAEKGAPGPWSFSSLPSPQFCLGRSVEARSIKSSLCRGGRRVHLGSQTQAKGPRGQKDGVAHCWGGGGLVGTPHPAPTQPTPSLQMELAESCQCLQEGVGS